MWCRNKSTAIVASGAAVALWFFPAIGKGLAFPAAMSRGDFKNKALFQLTKKQCFTSVCTNI